MKFFKSKPLWAVIVVGLGLAQQAVAHDQARVLLSSSGVKATDYYIVHCFTDPNLGGGAAAAKLLFQIKDTTGGGNLVGMTVFNPNAPTNAKAATTIDAIGGDPVYSASQSIAAGNGDYQVAVFHTGGAAVETYTFIYHCEDASGNHTGTNITSVSQQ